MGGILATRRGRKNDEENEDYEDAAEEESVEDDFVVPGNIVKVVDVYDATDGRKLRKWRLAEILRVKGVRNDGTIRIRVRFVGWSEKFDKDVEVPSDEVALFPSILSQDPSQCVTRLSVGTTVFVKDEYVSARGRKTFKWRKAVVRNLRGTSVRIHYVNWSDKWDCWIEDIDRQTARTLRLCIPLESPAEEIRRSSYYGRKEAEDVEQKRNGRSGQRRKKRRDPTSPSSPTTERATNTKKKSKTETNCDACDGPHETDDCPQYSKRGIQMAKKLMKARRSGKQLMDDISDGSGGYFVLPHSETRVVRQPGDGSCLFHSLAHGLGSRVSGHRLRKEISAHVRSHPDMTISGEPLRKWVQWASGESVRAYATRMKRSSSWGGGIEMAVFSRMFRCNLHVYESTRRGFKRISRFNVPRAKQTIHVLYAGRAHFDALAVQRRDAYEHKHKL
eukprot:g3189.t1